MALLLILTALAVPNYLAAMARANEASAASSVRAIIYCREPLPKHVWDIYGSAEFGRRLPDRQSARGRTEERIHVRCNPRSGHGGGTGFFDSGNTATFHRAVLDGHSGTTMGISLQ